jgi:hypothetical protein
MKKISFSLLLCLSLAISTAHAQLAVLFVDDSDDTFGNGELFAGALQSIGYPVTYFDAVASAASPADTLLDDFDLVIWYTSANGLNLQFWNGQDEDNPHLKAYLDQGGKLWVVGLDFLFDRYGPASANFMAGDFAYDYLGLKSYDLQSYGDDGNLGVPLAYPDTAQPITGLNTLSWQFSTLWWVDGVSLRPEALPIYRMGGATYVFADSVCGAWYDNGTSQVLSYYFDLALVADTNMLQATAFPVMAFFESIVSDIDHPTLSSLALTLYPNPAADAFTLRFGLEKSAHVAASLWDLQGRQVAQLLPEAVHTAGQQEVRLEALPALPNGSYLLRLEIDGKSQTRPLILAR